MQSLPQAEAGRRKLVLVMYPEQNGGGRLLDCAGTRLAQRPGSASDAWTGLKQAVGIGTLLLHAA